MQAIDLYSLAASNLVMGTAAQESHLEYVKQLGDGPALGLFQMEPATHDDIWRNFLDFRQDLSESICNSIDCPFKPPAERMVWDMRYAAIMCRVHYVRVPEVLPDALNVNDMARYWKKYYNTEAGAGTEAEFVENYKRVT